MLLGIYERCTPALSSQVGMLAATLASFSETQQVLLDWGNALDAKTIRLVAYRAAERARLAQKMGVYGWQERENLAGRRVVVSTDGGRIRLREKKRGPKTRKGRTRYHGAWREPKLCIIYVVDEEGRQHQQFAPLIDGVLNGPDALFALLAAYLQELEIQAADQLLFISDGATWIWNRIPALLETLAIASEAIRIFELCPTKDAFWPRKRVFRPTQLPWGDKSPLVGGSNFVAGGALRQFSNGLYHYLV